MEGWREEKTCPPNFYEGGINFNQHYAEAGAESEKVFPVVTQKAVTDQLHFPITY